MTVSGSLTLHFKITDGKRWKPKSGLVQNNTWIHVGGTWAVDGEANLYIDGVLNNTKSKEVKPEGPYTQKNMHVGKFNETEDRSKYGKFLLDEWYVWDRQLSEQQVAQVYAAYQTGIHAIHCSLFILVYAKFLKCQQYSTNI